MRFGTFDDEHCEYVITRPDTPLPWINYLGTESYFALISNTAGGYSFYRDARLRRITRFRYNNAPLDMGGRCLYLRDDAAAEPGYWSPTWMPTRTALDFYECRHGMGYTTITSELAGIRARITYFVPLGQDLEIWQVKVSNNRAEPASLSLFSAVEFCLWDALDDASNFQRNFNIGEVEVEDGVIFHKTEYRERRNHYAYFACSEPLAGFETRRDAFLGPYRGWDTPQAVEAGALQNRLASGWQPVGAHHVRLALDPGEEKTVLFLLGYQENPPGDKFNPPDSQTINKKGAWPVIHRFRQVNEVEQALAGLHAYWQDLLARFRIRTPEIHADRMVNIWNAYQVMVTFNFSRSASYFESGLGRGMGFRDSNQDLLGFMHLDPRRARQRILDLASTQLPDGGAYHQYQPLTRKGNRDVGSGFNDDPLWLILSTTAYLKETGDWTILDEPLPFDNTPGTEAPLYAHLQRSISYTLDRLGPHSLPLIGHADWNDCLNLNCFSDTPGQSFQTATSKDGKVAESVFIAGLFILAGKEMEAIARRLGRDSEADAYHSAWFKMNQAASTAGWDGDWFRRAYDDFGHPVGSRECSQGQIFIEPQGLCVMAGIGLEDGSAQKALDSVATRLAGRHGIVLLHPAYRQYQLHLGEISSYPPGYKENGSVFCHTNPWIMIAEAILGRGDAALDYYLRINPSARQELTELHRCEPYVYAQTIAGYESPAPGEAKNSWLTGAAAWNYVAITQWILGIRPEYDGLRVSPVIPDSWPGFQVQRSYRGVTYQVKAERIGPGNRVRLFANQAEVAGQVVPLPPPGVTEVHVLALLGQQ